MFRHFDDPHVLRIFHFDDLPISGMIFPKKWEDHREDHPRVPPLEVIHLMILPFFMFLFLMILPLMILTCMFHYFDGPSLF